MIPINKYEDKIKSVCKIKIDNIYGSGFLLKIPRSMDIFYCLMTNEHVITSNMINSNKIIEIKYNNQKEKRFIYLSERERFIRTYRYMSIDATVIQILKKDNISVDSFLSVNINDYIDYQNKINKFINKEIYILQYPLGNDLMLSKGKIVEIDLYKNQFTHKSSTEEGSSGSPVFDDNLVIGIHKQKSIDEKNNYGNFIFPIIISIYKNMKYMENKYDDGNYLGEYYNHKREGYGIFIYNNGEYYRGQWLNDKRDGKGILYYENKKIKYQGEFLNDEFNGNGLFYFDNGSYYKGEWKNGFKNGEGIFYAQNGKIKYDGHYCKNEYQGNGILYFDNGTYYFGNLYKSKPNGKGVLYYEKGKEC
jgi:hypothetical protein